MVGDRLLRPSSPLEAYRTDVAASPRGGALGPDDVAWLLVAELLDRRARPGMADDPARRDALAAELDAALRRAVPSSVERDLPRDDLTQPPAPAAEASGHAARAGWEGAVADVVLRLADVMEEAGALHLAYTTLWTLERAFPSLDRRRRALALAARARTARMAGASETAAGLYAAVARIGRATGDDDLVARSLLGRAVLARRRGNYPESRALYRRALRAAMRCGATELAGLAHHGLLIAASVAGDVSTALVHGWTAYELVGDDPSRQADLLGTLGAVGSAAGHYEAAIGAYLGAARRSPAARVRLPALAGAALCAAYLDDPGRLAAITRAVEGNLAHDALPFERAQALALLAQAWRTRGPGEAATRARGYAQQALEIARAGEYHELVLELEGTGAIPPTAPAANSCRVQAPARQVLHVLAHLDADAAAGSLAGSC